MDPRYVKRFPMDVEYYSRKELDKWRDPLTDPYRGMDYIAVSIPGNSRDNPEYNEYGDAFEKASIEIICYVECLADCIVNLRGYHNSENIDGQHYDLGDEYEYDTDFDSMSADLVIFDPATNEWNTITVNEASEKTGIGTDTLNKLIQASKDDFECYLEGYIENKVNEGDFDDYVQNY